MHRRLLLIDIIAAIIVVGGIVAVVVVVLGRNKGPAPTPFPTAQIGQQAASPPPTATGGAAAIALGNWPTYGYDDARTRYNPLIRLKPPYRTKWRYSARQLLEFPPSIYGNDLYFCTQHGWVVALHAGNGRRIWRHREPPGTLFASTPTVDARYVYVTSLGGRFDVLNRKTGKRAWGLAGIGRTESSPLVWRDRVFFGTEDGHVYALSIRTHRVVWRFRTGGAVKGAPAELNGRIVVGAYDGAVYCLTYNGRLIWRRSTGGVLSSNQFYATAALAYDTIYIGGTGGDIYAFDLHNGGLRWSYPTGGYVYSSPAVWRNMVFEGSYDGYFYALSAVSGSLIWRFYAGGHISGSPTVIHGIVYLSSFTGRTWGIKARTGRVVWTFPDGRYSPVTADRKTLYLNGHRTLYALVPVKR